MPDRAVHSGMTAKAASMSAEAASVTPAAVAAAMTAGENRRGGTHQNSQTQDQTQQNPTHDCFSTQEQNLVFVPGDRRRLFTGVNVTADKTGQLFVQKINALEKP